MSSKNSEQLAAEAMEAGDYERAVKLLQPLAERNSEYALLTLGWIYDTGATGTPDRNAARSYYEQAASSGSSAAYLYLGWLLLNDGQESEARKAFESGAQLDNDECKSVLIRLADKADEKLAFKAFEDRDYEQAARLLTPLAKRESEYALRTLGWIYETGATGNLDLDAARSHYARAVSGGSVGAFFDLGRVLLRQGEEAQARAAFEAGAERGDVPCMSELGRMTLEGIGGPSDPTTGLVWVEKAAAHGNIFAQRTLLAIEDDNAQSLSKKLFVKMKIAKLALSGARELWKDPGSDKVR